MGSLTVTPARSKSVVITGASSGLGRAAAIHLSELGYRVFAGVRTESSAAELSGMPSSRGELIPVMLDVTDAASIAQAGELVERSCSDTGLWAVVNNAGIAIGAPLECVPMDVMRTQLETNVVGVSGSLAALSSVAARIRGKDRQRQFRHRQRRATVFGGVRGRPVRQGGVERCAAARTAPAGGAASRSSSPARSLPRSGARCADLRTRSLPKLPPRSSRPTARDSPNSGIPL